MMSFEQKNMTGALFTNDKKGNDNAPGYKGNCLIGGQKYFISAWVKKDRNGKSYMSLSFEPPREQQNSAEQYRDTAQPSGSRHQDTLSSAFDVDESDDPVNPEQDMPF